MKSEEIIDYMSGNGGFTKDGAFVLETIPALPHCNIMAHGDFGTLITDGGGGYTWFKNSREQKLTEWKNDPVLDAPSEAAVITDKLTNADFSISRLPAFRKNARYKVIHSFGQTSFLCETGGIACRMNQFIDIDKEVKYYEIVIKNNGKKRRGFNVRMEFCLVLGDFRMNTARLICAKKTGGGVMAQNAVSGAAAHIYVQSEIFRFSCRDGILTVGCDAYANAGESAAVIFALSPRPNLKINDETAARAKERSAAFFNRLSSLDIKTPDRAFDALVNKWLPYQTYCSRFAGRCGAYQAGGAYGFRDQLQDCLALLYVNPAAVKEHILRAAAHQFLEGDVQHWWHPEKTGVRTRVSDDFLWLPYVTAEYIRFTGDAGILDISAPYLHMSELPQGTDAVYNTPPYSDVRGTLSEHCIRALQRALRFGANGLNLIGGGDWNDAFDEIGRGGKGESVWLTEFYMIATEKFLPYIPDVKLKAELSELLPHLKNNLLKNAWDGRWFKRAFWDDGTPLGGKDGAEAQIDLISNAFAILSGAVKNEKAHDCLAAIRERLVDKKAGLIKLLSPPFTKSGKRAGYINDYPPGTRENGGQYTHAAIWYILSLYKMGLNEEAYEMFSMINPVNICKTKAGADRYGAEPYVLAADVYSNPAHSGRAGWSYYTGSAAWGYKTAIEEILGLKIEGNRLYIAPKAPQNWDGFSITYKDTIFINAVRTKNNVKRVLIDGVEYNRNYINLNVDTVKKVIIEY